MEMASTPPNHAVDNQATVDIIGGTQADSVGLTAKSSASAVARLDEKFDSDHNGKTTLCCVMRK
jgi:hypothetical protein